MINRDKNKIEEFLNRGVEMIYPTRDFLKQKLESGARLSIYNGIDPTGPTLHLGHGIILKKLKEFQDLGHEVVLLIGDFTAMIGDPSGKSTTRKPLTHEQVLENAKLYKKQAGNFLDFDGPNKARLVYNSEWLAKMNFADVLRLASSMTVGQMLERDMFQERIKENKPIFIHEFMYPLMQGYDSVHLDIDGEIGGNDQTFNMLTGRNLMKSLSHREKFVVTIKLLVDSVGKKMGKTEDNMVTLLDSPKEMFGKVMSWTDSMISSGFELCTYLSIAEIEEIRKKIIAGDNPKDAKMRLAREIVSVYYGTKDAAKAENDFIKTFSEGGVPEDIVEINVKTGSELKEVLLMNDFVESRSEFRRLLDEGAISLNGEKITDPQFKFTKEGVVKVGKKRFLKVLL